MIPKASTEPLPELAEFLAPFAHHFQRSEGRGDLERYSTGLLSDIPRKNGDTIPEVIPGTNDQKIQELLTRIVWDQAAFNAQRVERMRDEVLLGDGVIILDDTGFAKQGKCSVGVARQYSGTLGKVGNCQVAVTGVYADPAVSWPLGVRLYLPEEWTDDKARCAQVGVPEKIGFETKPKIALHILDEARRLKVPHKAVAADAAYGADSLFLEGLESRDESYVVAVPCDFSVEIKGQSKQGSRRADAALHQVPLSSWKTISWREGVKGWLKKKFVAVRAYRTLGGQRKRLGWLIGERPARGQEGDWKYYFSNFSKSTPLETMVEYAHRRWHIEQFHEDAKSLLGWDDYQGRLWTGFHRHATVVMLTYSFLCWRQWRMLKQAPRLPGRPRNPFSPSKGQKTTASDPGPSAGS